MDQELSQVVNATLERRRIPVSLHGAIHEHISEHLGSSDQYGTRVLCKTGTYVAGNQVQYVIDDLVASAIDRAMDDDVDQKTYEEVRKAGLWPRRSHG